MYLKQERITDKKYLQSARDKCCLICGSRGTTVMHHLRTSSNAGTGVKAGDNQCLPLCNLHHDEIHRSEKAFADKYKWAVGNDIIAFAELLYKRHLDKGN